ncbi:flagellar export chaperone FliS [Candidatus Neomarinimicrobiota bacterium]
MFRAQALPRAIEQDPYLKQKVMSASPEQLISYVYDVVLAACHRKDQEKALRGLMGLVNALNFEYKDIAVPMYQLYQYCLEKVRKREFDEVEGLIGGLKSAWVEAMKVN